MKTKITFLLLIIPVIFILQGCYTVVMVSNPQPSYVSEDSYSYEDVEDTSVIGEQPDVVNHYYIYGDLWPGYVPYDPFWSSPYWVHYPSWNRWSLIYDPWGWDSYWPYSYGFNYSYYPTHYWNRYYYDPYDVYWNGYYDGSYYGGVPGYRIKEKEKQPFHDRASSAGSGLMGVPARQTNVSSGVAKQSNGQSSSFYNRQRLTVSDGQPVSTAATSNSGSRSVVSARSSGSRAGASSAASSSSQRTSKRNPSVSSSSSRASHSSSSVRAPKPQTSSQPVRHSSSQSSESSSRSVSSSQSSSSSSSSRSVSSSSRSSSGSSSSSSSQSSSSGSSGRSRKR